MPKDSCVLCRFVRLGAEVSFGEASSSTSSTSSALNPAGLRLTASSCAEGMGRSGCSPTRRPSCPPAVCRCNGRAICNFNQEAGRQRPGPKGQRRRDAPGDAPVVEGGKVRLCLLAERCLARRAQCEDWSSTSWMWCPPPISRMERGAEPGSKECKQLLARLDRLEPTCRRQQRTQPRQ